MEGKVIKRYSDVYDDKVKQRGWWYFTTHGVQPGSIPSDLHVLEIKENKTYNVIKDGVRDATSLALIGSGSVGLVKLVKSRKLLKKTCELADAGGKTIEEVVATATSENAAE